MPEFLDRLLGRTPAPQGGGPMMDEVAELAKWVPVSSSWVQAIRYLARTEDRGGKREWAMGTLQVRFLAKGNSPSVVCSYPNITRETFLSMKYAPSKGRFVHAFLMEKPYRLL